MRVLETSSRRIGHSLRCDSFLDGQPPSQRKARSCVERDSAWTPDPNVLACLYAASNQTPADSVDHKRDLHVHVELGDAAVSIRTFWSCIQASRIA